MKHSFLSRLRRLLAMTLALALVFSLTGCFQKEDPQPSEDPTEIQTEPSTETPTAAPTEETAPMTIPTAPTREPEQTSPGGNGWIGLVLIVCVLSGVLLGMLLTRSAAARRQKGGKYSR